MYIPCWVTALKSPHHDDGTQTNDRHKHRTPNTNTTEGQRHVTSDGAGGLNGQQSPDRPFTTFKPTADGRKQNLADDLQLSRENKTSGNGSRVATATQAASAMPARIQLAEETGLYFSVEKGPFPFPSHSNFFTVCSTHVCH